MALIPWLDHYNTEGPHAALAHHPPAARLRQSSCLVRPKGPLLRPDLPPIATGAATRGKDRRRRPAIAGAQRPCSGSSLRSRSLKEGPMLDGMNNLLGNNN
jgi:hypothetical protein